MVDLRTSLLAPDIALTTVLTQRTPLTGALQSAGPNLDVLTSARCLPARASSWTAGRLCGDPRDGRRVRLHHHRLRALARGGRRCRGGRLADATLTVHRAAKTSLEHVTRSLATLLRIGHKPAGVVLNMVTAAKASTTTRATTTTAPGPRSPRPLRRRPRCTPPTGAGRWPASRPPVLPAGQHTVVASSRG